MAEAKKSPAEVWKILPLKHKIISVVAAALVLGFFGVFAVVQFWGLTPARDLTGTWRNPISGQGFVVWGTDGAVTYPGEKVYPSGPNPEDADIVQYYDVEWKVTQSGNTMTGPMTISLVKKGGQRPFMSPEGLIVDPSGTHDVTGTVEGTKITITSEFLQGMSGTFTADMMTLTAHYPVSCVPPPGATCFSLDARFKLSLSRVW